MSSNDIQVDLRVPDVAQAPYYTACKMGLPRDAGKVSRRQVCCWNVCRIATGCNGTNKRFPLGFRSGLVSSDMDLLAKDCSCENSRSALTDGPAAHIC